MYIHEHNYVPSIGLIPRVDDYVVMIIMNECCYRCMIFIYHCMTTEGKYQLSISPSLAGCGHYDATPTACYSAMAQLGMYVCHLNVYT